MFALAVCVAFYAWSAGTTYGLLDERPSAHARMADAFAHGQLALREDPPRGLLALPNPYDPAASEPFRRSGIGDLSLYDGKLHAYWGPAPAVLFYTPLALVGIRPTDSAMVLLFCLVVLGAGTWLLERLARLMGIALRTADRVLAVLVLAAGNGGVFLLRGFGPHEVAIGAGAAFLLVGLGCLLRGTIERPGSVRWLAGGSACVGLAIGSRWTLLPALAVPALISVGYLTRRLPRDGASARSVQLGLLAPVTLAVASLLAYNAARFGSPLETGIRYQLTAVDWNRAGLLDPSGLPEALVHLLALPPVLRAQFPYFFLDPRDLFPGAFLYREPMAGVLAITPILLLLALGPWAVRARRDRLVLAVPVGLAALILLSLGMVPSLAMRFDADYVSLLLIPALIVWFAAMRRGRGRAFRIAGTALAATGIVVGVGLSISTRDVLRIRHPAVYARLERFFAPLPTFVSRVTGRPVLAGVERFAILPPSREELESDDFAVADRSVTVQLVSGERRIARLAFTPEVAATPAAQTPALRASGSTTATAVLTPRQRQEVPVALRPGINEVTLAVEWVGRRRPLQFVLLKDLRLVP